MKQTIVILTALATVLLATGLIVANNLELSRVVEARESELYRLGNELEEQREQLKRYAGEEAASAETLRQTMEERDALSKQLDAALAASQEAGAAMEQQVLRNQKQLQEMESLAAEYEDLSAACDALEARILSLSEEAARTAMTHEAQTLADAKRIAELEKALAEALDPTPTPTESSKPSPAPSPTDSPIAKPTPTASPSPRPAPAALPESSPLPAAS